MGFSTHIQHRQEEQWERMGEVVMANFEAVTDQYREERDTRFVPEPLKTMNEHYGHAEHAMLFPLLAVATAYEFGIRRRR